jgi:uncharacterized membrane protein YphA (DoxX/SURF4 family)
MDSTPERNSDMSTAYLTVTLIAVAADGFSGIAALLHMQAIVPGMAKAGVPVSWLTFPIGTLKTAGALGLAAGLAFRPLGVAAAIGLVLFFVCALYTHIRASDYSPQFYLANVFLALNVAALALTLRENHPSAFALALS